MKTIGIILIVFFSIVVYFIIAALVHVFLAKMKVFDSFCDADVGRIFVSIVWPASIVIMLPIFVYEFVLNKFGYETEVFKFKKK